MNRIKEVLKEKGYTVASFAEVYGTSKQNVNQLIKTPSFASLEKIAALLDVPMWQLFASPSEVVKEEGVIICPHCRKPIKVKFECGE